MSTKKIVIALIIFSLSLIVGYFFQIDREKKLKNRKETKAIVIYSSEFLTKNYELKVYYIVDSSKYEVGFDCDCRTIKKGDTVLIEYAVENPKIAVLKDKHYMQKYRNKK